MELVTFERDLMADALRYDYLGQEVLDLLNLPMTRLLYYAQTVHRRNFPDNEVQLCTLLSVKTGGCKEDCAYCPQSAHYDTDIDAHGLLPVEKIVGAAKNAKSEGATRFCMGAAWRSPPTRGTQFAQLLKAIREVNSLGLEVCTTLGMLTLDQAKQLKGAGVYAYNHNLDTSPEYYESIITTRTYADRLATLENVRSAGITVCCGGIVGLGESRLDRAQLLVQLNRLRPHPESVPINMLMRVEGTPLADVGAVDIFEMVRMVAAARMVLPKSRVRLSAGRTEMSDEAQALCFLAGANSVFCGERLLTAPNPEHSRDQRLFARLGIRPAVSAQNVGN